MKSFARAALGVLLLAGATFGATAPAAAAEVGISFGFGGPGYALGDPCDYYDYYDGPPPWGLPPDYCDYPVYFEPVYFDGYWYRGPIYYRWNHGRRLFWLHGGWREDGWRGGRPPAINWQNRGGRSNGFRPGTEFRGGPGWHGGVGRRPQGDDRRFGHGDHPWTGGARPWSGGGHGGFGGGAQGGVSHGHH